ncbi:MAG TPA: hypothetical protein VMF06_13250 [Candidatus Limnocylindria bacterium]|jgi:hypothetical protein|nr:hypothetical protein [Candidatus Limnocylindria bacterium]
MSIPHDVGVLMARIRVQASPPKSASKPKRKPVQGLVTWCCALADGDRSCFGQRQVALSGTRRGLNAMPSGLKGQRMLARVKRGSTSAGQGKKWRMGSNEHKEASMSQ